jgi:hypothetical protein
MTAELEAVVHTIDAHLKAHPDAAVLEAWRWLRRHVMALDDQRYAYLVIGMCVGFAIGIIVAVVVLPYRT